MFKEMIVKSRRERERESNKYTYLWSNYFSPW